MCPKLVSTLLSSWPQHIEAVRATHVDVAALVAEAEVVDDRGLVEVGEVGNVVCAVKVGRVDAGEEVRLDGAHLAAATGVSATSALASEDRKQR